MWIRRRGGCNGMSVRAWLAGQALVGILSSTPYWAEDTPDQSAIASWACCQADAMLAELEKAND